MLGLHERTYPRAGQPVRLILLGWRQRFKTAALAFTAIIVGAGPFLTARGWALLALAVALLIGTVVVCDALDLMTVLRDFLAWRKERDEEARRISERRRERIVGRIGQ